MKLSANLGFLYTDLPMTDRIEAAARDGFDAVEFHWPYDTPAVDLRAALRRAGLLGLGLNTRRGDVAAGEFGLAAISDRRAEALGDIDEAIDYAVAADLSSVHVMAGIASGPKAETCFTDNLKHACARAEEHGLTILMEPLNTRDVPGYFLTGTDQAQDLIARVGSPKLKIMYDLYHMQIMQGDHVTRLAALGDLIGHIQIASVPDRTEPDVGEVDARWVLSACRYAGFVGAEFKPTRPPGNWIAHFRESADTKA